MYAPPIANAAASNIQITHTGKSVIENQVPTDNEPILPTVGGGVGVGVGVGVEVGVKVDVGVGEAGAATAGKVGCVGTGLAVLLKPRVFELTRRERGVCRFWAKAALTTSIDIRVKDKTRDIMTTSDEWRVA